MSTRVGSPKGWWGSGRLAHGGNLEEQDQAPDPQEAGRGPDLDQLSKTRLKWRPGWPSWELLRPESV